MDVRLLKHFVAVVDHGNMLRASEAVFVTQPALTKSIKYLEKELDVRLLDRLRTGVAPTRSGLQLYKHAKLIINQLNRAEAEIKAGTSGQWNHVRIGLGLNFAGSILADAVFHVLNSHPEVTATVISKTFDELVPLLLQGDLDLAVAVFPFDNPHPDLVYELLVQDEFQAICRKDHPLVGHGRQPLERLKDEAWVLFDRPEFIVSLFNTFFLDKGLIAPRPAIQTNSTYILKSAIREGNRIAYLPPSIVFEELRKEEFVILPTEIPKKQTKAGIIYRANDIIPDAVLDIINTLRKKGDKLCLAK